jgi:hypothetical protein
MRSRYPRLFLAACTLVMACKTEVTVESDKPVTLTPTQAAPQAPQPKPVTDRDLIREAGFLPSFSKILPSNSLVNRAQSPSEIKYVGCVGKRSVVYFDLSRKKWPFDFRAVEGFKSTTISTPKELIEPMLIVDSEVDKDSSGRLTRLQIRTPREPKVRYSARIVLDDEMNGFYTQSPTPGEMGEELMRCEFFFKPYFQKSDQENLFYECGGYGGMWFLMARPNNAPILVGFEREETLADDAGSYDDYYKYWRPFFFIDKSKWGQSVHSVDWVQRSGVYSATIPVRYQLLEVLRGQPLPALDWNQLFESRVYEYGRELSAELPNVATPSESFWVTRREMAPWLNKDDKGRRRRVQQYLCGRVD